MSSETIYDRLRGVEPRFVEPIAFWMWNDTPTPASIDQHLDAMLASGFRAAYIHPMPDDFRHEDFHGGLRVRYLSDAFFDLVALACEKMQQREMMLWLYDEGGWPSGVAGGEVVAENPAYGVWTLNKEGSEVKPAQMLDRLPYPDLMNPEATACFIRTTHEKYRQAVGHAFGTTVPGMFTDEPRLMGRVGTDTVPWSPFVPEAFERMCGYALDGVIEKLFDPDPVDDDTQRIRRDYIRVVSTLVAEHFYAPCRAWCEQHGLLFEGHHSGEDHFGRHGQVFGHYLQQARQYHVPGVDTIWRQIFPGHPYGNFVALASSSAWTAGNRYAMTENFAVYGAGLTLHEMRWVTAYQMVRGINRVGLMTWLGSTTGARQICTCSNFSMTDPRNIDLHRFNDWVRRVAGQMIEGDAVPTVGVFYRSELVPLNRQDDFNLAHEAVCDRIGDQLNALLFVDIEDIEAGELPLGVKTLVVHHDAPLEDAERTALERLAANGCRVIYAKSAEDVDVSDASLIETDGSYVNVRVLPFRVGDGMRFLFFNQGEKAALCHFRLKDGGRDLREVTVDDDLSATLEPLTWVKDGWLLLLYPGQIRVVETEKADTRSKLVIVDATPIDQSWERAVTERFVLEENVRREAVTSPVWEAAELGDYAEVDPHFSGSLTYRCTFDFPKGASDMVTLSLDGVYYACEVSVNGQVAGTRAWAPYRFDISRYVKAGRNELVIRVTNTLANQWYTPAAEKRQRGAWANGYVQKAEEYMPDSLHAGLVGPVVLRRHVSL